MKLVRRWSLYDNKWDLVTPSPAELRSFSNGKRRRRSVCREQERANCSVRVPLELGNKLLTSEAQVMPNGASGATVKVIVTYL